MADQTTDQLQLPLGMTYSTAYSLGIEAPPVYSATNDQETIDQREGSKDSDQEESDGRRRGGFERDLRSDRENRRYSPYSTSRSKGRVSSSALKDYRVYVSNIPYNVRWQDLKDYMKKIGEVSFVEIFEDEKGRSKGCGVVEFKEKEDAEKAISQYNGQDFQGRPLQVREDRVEEDSRMHRSRLRGNTISQNTQPNASNLLQGLPGLGGLPALLSLANAGSSMANKNDPSSCTVFVSNLDFRVTWQKLKDAFKVAGNVVRANVKEDDNHKSKGYGTVQFDTPTEAMNAVMLLNGQMIMDRTITVRMDRNATSGGGLRGSSQASTNPLAAAAGSQVAILNLLQSLQGLTALANLGNLGSNLGNTNLGNLSNTTTNQSYGGMTSVPAASGTAGSTSAVGMDAANLAALSGMMNQLGSATSTSNYGATNYGTSAYGTSSYGTSSYGNTASSSTAHSECTSGKQIFVRNLPWKYTWQDLKDKFRAAGNVSRADILTETGGRSKGCGIVVFETQEEAQRAIALYNGASFDGREIDVRLDRFG